MKVYVKFITFNVNFNLFDSSRNEFLTSVWNMDE